MAESLQPVDLEKVVSRFDTPVYLYDMDAALGQLVEFRARMPACVDVYYAMKANPNPSVLGAFKEHVAGLDISSAGELHLATGIGFDPACMSFAGPGKSQQELVDALEQHVHLISVESVGELRRLATQAEQRGRKAQITIRVNPSSIPNAFMMKMGGRPSQFGIAEEDVEAALREALEHPAIDLQGLHIYSGTQCLDETAIVQNLRQTLEINQRLAEKFDLHPEIVNLGGGFGVAYFAGQQPLDNVSLARQVGQTVGAFAEGQKRFSSARFIFELGRYLIGPFGTYLTRVIEIKETRGKRFVIMDGGMNHCFAATGNFGQLVKKNYPVANLAARGDQAEAHELVGPLCTPLDSMGRGLQMPRAEVGDLLAFQCCGAYAYTASPLLFLGHDTPAEVVRFKGELALARERMPATRFI